MNEQKKLLVRGTEWYCNINITHIVREDAIIYAYNGDSLVGVFDVGGFLAMWISEKQNGGGTDGR